MAAAAQGRSQNFYWGWAGLSHRGADDAILKNQKRPYLLNGLTDLHKIWHGAAFWPSEGYGHLTLHNLCLWGSCQIMLKIVHITPQMACPSDKGRDLHEWVKCYVFGNVC